MATVTITTAATGLTTALHDWYVPNLNIGRFMSCNVYQVAIELSSSDMPDVVRSKITSETFVYPPLYFTRPRNITTRSQTHDGELSRRVFLSSFGKAYLFATSDIYDGYTPAGGEYALSLTYEFTDSNGDYGYSTIWRPYTSGPSDAGTYIGAYGKLTGDGTGYAYATSLPAPTADVYFFYINIDTASMPFASDFSVGINDATMQTIFGSECIGAQLVFTSVGGISLNPTYRASGILAYNKSPRPSIARPDTFSSANIFQQDWHNIYAISGSATSQIINTPVSEMVYQTTLSGHWCVPGISESVVMPMGPGLMADAIFKAYFYSQLGKIINPSGTVITGSTHEATTFPFGRGGVAGYAYLSFTPPSGACYYRITREESVYSPGVEEETSSYAFTRAYPPQYASDYGDWIPGNCMSGTLSESDIP